MFEARMNQMLTARKAEGLYRDPLLLATHQGRIATVAGKEYLNFASNDYLGLGNDPSWRAAVGECFTKYAPSSSSSPLVCGHFAVVDEAEQAYAEFFGYEEAVFFPSGFQANEAVVSTFLKAADVAVYDKRVHASTVRGLRSSSVLLKGFNHGDCAHLLRRLDKNPDKDTVVFTESLYSMDADLLDVSSFQRVREQKEFVSVVDEAHAFGVLGINGCGHARAVADVAVGTFGKGLGFFGAFALMPKGYRDFLVNFSSPLIYSTALPEAHAAAAIQLLGLLRQSDDRREAVLRQARKMRILLSELGLQVQGDAHILAVKIGDEHKAVQIADALRSKGILLFASRFPTVPRGKALLRMGMTALHTDDDLHTVAVTMAQVLQELST
ncbi:MAG: aminotransferase class I/II-fold pyridoxal phosphate-dependent enzyme [Desulfovibrio sp.]